MGQPGINPPTDRKRFALIGAAGFVAPRHLKAIKDLGHELVAAVDPHDSAGVLDDYFPDARFFTEIERFDRFLEKLRRTPGEQPVDYVSICSPNYLHDAHVRLALRVKAHAVCEKPLVINPWNLDQLAELEAEHGLRVYCVHQMRLHPAVLALKERLDREPGARHDVRLTYVTRRGAWYHSSWKGSPEKSGGLAMNIGVHFFDLLLWLFGPTTETAVHTSDDKTMAGSLKLQRADVRWLLSIDHHRLPDGCLAEGRHAHRAMTVDGEEVDFTLATDDLHTACYRAVLGGRAVGIAEARPAIELVHAIRRAPVTHDAD